MNTKVNDNICGKESGGAASIGSVWDKFMKT